jgi:hypothetical protein
MNKINLKKIVHYDAFSGHFFWLPTSAAAKRKRGKPSKCGLIVAGNKTSRGYRDIMILGKSYKEHRLAWLYVTGKWPKDQIDHINRNREDNRFENIREATNSQNKANTGRYKNSSGKYKGVSYREKLNKWCARIQVDKNRKWLGAFNTEQEARDAYNAAAKIIFGEFANFGGE